MKKQELFFSIDQLSVVQLVGEGYSSNRVYLAHDQSGQYLALKVFRNNPANQQLALHEIEILQQLEHPHIVALLGYSLHALQLRTKLKHGRLLSTSKYKIVIIFEYVPQGELFDLIKREGSLGECRAKFFFCQLLETLEYLSSQQVAHKDLKPENILLDQLSNIKLIDFGFSDQSEEPLSRRFQGTKSYMSPEMLEKKQYSRQANDLFSLGVILFIMVLGWPPFNLASSQDPHYKLLINKNYPRFWQMHLRQAQIKAQPCPFFCTPSFMDLVQHMLNYLPRDRLSFQQVMQHPWLTTPFAQRLPTL